MLFTIIEWLIGMLTPTPEGYADTIVPLLVSAELEAHSGAMFDRKGRPVLASAGLTTERVASFIAASEKLVALP